MAKAPSTPILQEIVVSRIGMRDTASGTNKEGEEEDSESEIELYWDIILLTESQFLLSSPANGDSKQTIKKFQRYIVKKIGESLNQMVKPKKKNIPEKLAFWRNLGLRYTLVYLPLQFKDIIWCKSDSIYFHVILPKNRVETHERRQTNDKEWLLALLELASTLDLQYMRLYIGRDDLNGVSTFLRNLNWIGGRLVPNEDRNTYITHSSTNAVTNDNTEFNELLLGDEKFVILEFEC